MCYSAQIAQRFHIYKRITGAEIDIEQFMEIEGFRARGGAVRIPRAVDQWFGEPATDGGRRIKNLIDQFRTAKVTALEQEIFAQRKRLADATRKLAAKPTKAAAESQRIATAKVEKALRDLPLYAGNAPTALDGRIFPMSWVPVVVHEGGRNLIRLARYHLRRPGDPEATDRKYPGLYNARRDNLERYWRGQFGTTHAVMLADGFYENVDRGGQNVVLHFRPQPARTMLIACLYAEWPGPDGARMPCFAAITDDPPPEVAATGHDRVPITLRPENLQRWLTPTGRDPAELQAILDERPLVHFEHEVLAA